MAGGDSVIAVHGVTKTFGPVRALSGVTCRFGAGRVTVVRGPNGSGKSTLLAIVGTLARATSGTIDYGALGSSRLAVRQTLGWLGHDSLAYLDLTGRQNLALAARLQGVRVEESCARVVDRFDLGAFVDRAARTYSRGQRQRLALARSLVHRPLLLLLDEPTTGLDDGATARLGMVVQEEAARGATVVVVTHDAVFAEAVAAEIVTLDRGRSGATPR